MTFLDRLRNRSSHQDAGSPEARSTDADQLPIPGYDRLDAREVGVRLSELSQVELGAVEAYERSHQERPEILDKLRYMRTTEPLPGYDDLGPEQIADALANADSETIKNVRDYERKFQRRPEVMDETARVLPTSSPSAREVQVREDQATLLREGFEGREKTAGDLADEPASS